MRRLDLTSPTLHDWTFGALAGTRANEIRNASAAIFETETTGSQIDSADNAARRVTGNPCIMP